MYTKHGVSRMGVRTISFCGSYVMSIEGSTENVRHCLSGTTKLGKKLRKCKVTQTLGSKVLYVATLSMVSAEWVSKQLLFVVVMSIVGP